MILHYGYLLLYASAALGASYARMPLAFFDHYSDLTQPTDFDLGRIGPYNTYFGL